MQPLHGGADRTRRQPYLGADRVHRQSALVQQNFQHTKVGVAQAAIRERSLGVA